MQRASQQAGKIDAAGGGTEEPEPFVVHIWPGMLTRQEIGDMLGMSRQRVEQIERRALRKMAKHPLLAEWARALAGAEGEE